MSDLNTAPGPPPDISHVHLQHDPPRMWRINGIGTAIAGRHNDPAMAPWYYKQLVWTFAFIPVFLGRIYVVRDAGAGRGWYFAGWVSGSEFTERYGSQAYWTFKARVMFGAMAILIIVLAAVLVFAVIVPFFQGKR